MFYLLTQDHNNDLGWTIFTGDDEAEAGLEASEVMDGGDYRDGIFLTPKQCHWLKEKLSTR